MAFEDSAQFSTPRDDAGGGESIGREIYDREFSCRVVSSGDRVILVLSGEIDIASAADADEALSGLELRPGAWLAIDMRELSFIDSTGVRLILDAMRYAEEHGARLALVRGPDAVHRLLELVGLAEQVLTVDDPWLLD